MLWFWLALFRPERSQINPMTMNAAISIRTAALGLRRQERRQLAIGAWLASQFCEARSRRLIHLG
jgi:hypothetical protein